MVCAESKYDPCGEDPLMLRLVAGLLAGIIQKRRTEADADKQPLSSLSQVRLNHLSASIIFKVRSGASLTKLK